jgi:ubiquitin carboxyl-terminal hydrolase 5/13
VDGELATHLLTLGIPISTQSKTEKSITEMQIEQNLKFDFSMTDESGEPLKPITGPGLTGLQNLGNSCYMASTMQVLFALQSWRLRYLPTANLRSLICPVPLPADCIDCQMH